MKNHYETMYDCIAEIDGTKVNIPKGTPLKRLVGGGTGQPNFYVAYKPKESSIHLTDWNTYYLQPEDRAVFRAIFVRAPITEDKSAQWQDRANKWLIDIRGQTFDFYAGTGRTAPPSYDDVMSCLLSDSDALTMTFEDWADEFGYDRDSRKAYQTWEDCCTNARKLIKTSLDLDAERTRLQDY